MVSRIKLLLACALLALLVWSADWEGRYYVELISGRNFALVMALLVLGLVVSTWKWSCALRLQRLEFSFWPLFKALCGGFFLNNFLPTSVGGDAYRIYKTLPSDGYRLRAVAAVVLERGVGLGALIVLGGFAAVGAAPQFAVANAYLIASFTVVVLAGVTLFTAQSGFVREWIDRQRQSVIVQSILNSIGHLRGQRENWLVLIVLSFAFQAISISVIYLLFRDIGTEVSWLHCALIAALVGVAGALPITINGIGVAEGALVGAAFALGIGYEQALVVAILRRLVAIGLGVLCGFVYAFEQRFAASRADSDAASAPGAEQGRLSAATREQCQASSSEATLPMSASAFLEHSEEAIVIWELHGQGVLYWNRAAELLYGYSREEALGKQADALLQIRFSQGRDQLRSALVHRGVWAGSVTINANDGRELPVKIRLALLRQRDGRSLVLETSRYIVDLSMAEAEQTVMAKQLGALTSMYST